MFSVILHNQGSRKNVKNDEDISNLLSEYIDIFPDQLPRGIPPKRTEGDFQIELKEYAKPIKNGRSSYTMIIKHSSKSLIWKARMEELLVGSAYSMNMILKSVTEQENKMQVQIIFLEHL